MVTLGLVVAEFNSPITEKMEERAREAATEADAEIAESVSVPGAYDTPLAADRLARHSDIDAVAVLGSIITGDTDHDKVIADSAAQGLRDVSLDRDKPVTLGIAGPGMTPDEARDRTDYGASAVESAVKLVNAL